MPLRQTNALRVRAPACSQKLATLRALPVRYAGRALPSSRGRSKDKEEQGAIEHLALQPSQAGIQRPDSAQERVIW
jgi:hypothetical protein